MTGAVPISCEERVHLSRRREMIVTTSWDDGDVLDERLADLLDRHSLRGTFYMARSHRKQRLPNSRIQALSKRHEIAAHTLSHPDLTLLSRPDKWQEIEGSKKWLEDVTGDAVPMFCYPFGRFDAEVKLLVAEAGFKGARTTRQFVVAADFDRFSMGTTLQVYPALIRRCSFRDLASFLLAPLPDAANWQHHYAIASAACFGWSRFGASVLKVMRPRDIGIFHLWGHSWEIDQFGMWKELDTFLGILSEGAGLAETNGSMVTSSSDDRHPRMCPHLRKGEVH